jgi:hypothetical protein
MSRLNYEFTKATLCYTWRCSICGNTEQQTYEVPRGGAVPLSELPRGWRKYWMPNDSHYARFCCPEHGMQLSIDGAEVWSEKLTTVIVEMP